MSICIVKRWRKQLFIGGLVFLTAGLCHAQSDTLLQQANRQYTLKAYGPAIEIYTQLLSGSSGQLTAEQRITAQANRAHSYKLTGDLKKAEQAYRDLINATELTGAPVESYRQYAQTLAEN